MRRSLCALLAGPAALAFAAPAAPTRNNNSSEKLRSAVTLEGVRSHQQALQGIAGSVGGNRFAGLAGDDRSADYVADRLRAAGYSPTFQEFTYNAFFEQTPSQLIRTAPTQRTFVNGNDFRVMS